MYCEWEGGEGMTWQMWPILVFVAIYVAAYFVFFKHKPEKEKNGTWPPYDPDARRHNDDGPPSGVQPF
jgi:hypothetical protein